MREEEGVRFNEVRFSLSAAGTLALVACLAVLATLAQAEPVSGAAPKWKVVGNRVTFAVRGSYVSGNTDVRLVGVRLPPFSKKKHRDFQKGGRFWVLERHRPRNIRVLYKGQTVRAAGSIQIHEMEPAIQYNIKFVPKGAARPVFSALGRGSGRLVFTTNAGPVSVPVTVSIIPYGG